MSLTAIFASIAYAENKRLHDTVIADSGSFVSTGPDLVDDVVVKATRIQREMLTLSTRLPGAISEAAGLVRFIGVAVEGGVNGLITEIETKGLCLLNANLTGPSGTTYPCPFCTSVSQTVTNATSEVRSQTATLLADFTESVDSIEREWVNKSQQITDETSNFNDTINDVLTDVLELKNDYSDQLFEEADKYESKRDLAFIILFLLPLIMLVWIVVAAFLKVDFMFRINYWVGFLITFIMWLLFAIHFPLSVVLSDVCVELDVEESRIRAGTPQSGELALLDWEKGSRACLLNESLIDVFNLTDELDYARNLKFPETYNLTNEFEFAELDKFKTDIEALNFTDFSFDAAQQIDARIVQLNSYLNTAFTATNISLLNPADYTNSSFAAQQKQLIVLAIQDSNFIATTLNTCKGELVQVFDIKDSTADLLDSAQVNLTRIEDIARPLIDSALGLVDREANCKFVGDFYVRLRDNVCDKTMNHLAILSMCMFFISMLYTPWILCCSQRVADRWSRPEKELEDDGIPLDEMGRPIFDVENPDAQSGLMDPHSDPSSRGSATVVPASAPYGSDPSMQSAPVAPHQYPDNGPYAASQPAAPLEFVPATRPPASSYDANAPAAEEFEEGS
jgi:hypothetical protein